ncbi:MAG: hypothetical protein JWP09_823 [Candidatus Taylorbacteria bacterium]|nr:hypothetical protein [Candidatus Taylorbacteria bacterium]
MTDTTLTPIDTTQNPHIYGELWTIAENWTHDGVIVFADIKEKLNLHLDPVQLGGSIRGNDLYEHLKEQNINVLNATIWQYLRDHHNEIPENWKIGPKDNAQYIFFWGTIDRSPEGDLYVRYISWTGGNWVFGNYLLSGNWHEDFPAAVLVK